MELFLRNTLTGLIPLYPSDQDEKKRLKLGQDYKAKLTLPRNLAFHKKFFALFNIAYQNTSLNMSEKAYRHYLTIKAGYFTAYQTPKGIFYEPDSISFDNMDQAEFEVYYQRFLDVVIKEIGSTSEEIENMLIEFM
jgi:hypothetical protein